ncbi:MAG: RNA-binding transcriptional accessory protein [Psychroflexus sp.]|nr:RNA-binding transcriptional accessory protein [Psychroflexus sp.]
MHLNNFVQHQTGIPLNQLSATLGLLNADATIPFIARYRKEQTGNLDEVQIENILKAKETYEKLENRRASILETLENQDDLTEELKLNIEKTQELAKLEDLYLPFKKKRKTKADVAREQGVEPLAKMIMAQQNLDLNQVAKKYFCKDLKSVDAVLVAARLIMSEWISERLSARDFLRYQYANHALIETKVIKTKKGEPKAQKFVDYFDWSERLKKIPSHRFLAIQRAEKESFIRVKLQLDDDYIFSKIVDKLIKKESKEADQIRLALEDALKRLLLPSLSNEALQNTKKEADEAAIEVFAKNLRQLLLAPPLGEKGVLAIDPGFRTGCKIVCLDAEGNLKHNETIFPHAPQNKSNEAIKKISTLVEAYKIKAIAIGNGTASRETEALVKRIHFKNAPEVFVVSEAGASIYSASAIAREEFPNYDVTVRGAISIGRRLQDPLAELVKIDPKSIGVGQYQHDVDQSLLKKSLDRVVESCVNSVGINLNTASYSLLSYVSGIGPGLAKNIVDYRQENKGFKSRAELKKVKRLGDKAYQLSAGFLRVKRARNPLDDSAVHPEQYQVVKAMAKNETLKVIELIGNKSVLSKLNLEQYCSDELGLFSLQDIVKELEKAGLDQRETAKAFAFNQNIKTIEDVEEGQLLPGIVNNITNFGCFVDIGIKESGLIHVSNLADAFVKDINAHVSLHQQILIKVLDVDEDRKRIQLKLEKTLS